jgi:hypothetical protein
VYVDVPVRSGADAYGYGYGPSADSAAAPQAETAPGSQLPAVVVVPAETGRPGDKPTSGPGVSKASR